ncbi:MAG: discoidin domain-containing protein [Deltaproteobacteria bacterium]|nr:discoidin domain-containing protein [Deltaproteobacteria bacterium]
MRESSGPTNSRISSSGYHLRQKKAAALRGVGYMREIYSAVKHFPYNQLKFLVTRALIPVLVIFIVFLPAVGWPAGSDPEDRATSDPNALPAIPGAIFNDSQPESTPINLWVPLDEVSFGAKNASIGVDLGSPKRIDTIKLVGNLSEKGGKTIFSGNTLAVYTSLDNKTYSRYTGSAQTETETKDTDNYVILFLTIKGLTINTRYLKIVCTANFDPPHRTFSEKLWRMISVSGPKQ